MYQMSVKITYAKASKWYPLSFSLSRARVRSPIKEQLFGCQNLAPLRRTLRWCSSFYGRILFLLSFLLFFLFLLFAAGGGAESDWYHNSVISNWRKPELTLSRVYQRAPIIYGFTVYRGQRVGMFSGVLH